MPGARTTEPRAQGAGRVLIAGTGRAGTTLLVRIFTRLGLDTGFSEADFERVEKRLGRAGLERSVSKRTVASLPEIVKSPWVVDVLQQALAEGWLTLDLAIIPMRDLDDAAASRARVSKEAARRGRDPGREPGGPWKTETAENQSWVRAEQFYRVVLPLVVHEVSTCFLAFLRFVSDAPHFVRCLGASLRARYGLSDDAIYEAHRSECRPQYVSAGL